MTVDDVTLEGDLVRLEPMRPDHVETLFEMGNVKEIWQWTTTNIEKFSDMQRYVESALSDKREGKALPFVTIDRGSGTVVGATRFGNISRENRSTEIGWTWINPSWQRTYINTEAKLLMLTHAFETWKCIRVEIITDVNNEKSRAAILRLGAKQEGILRNHLIVDSGRIRDSVVFSIIDSEWNSVKQNLLEKLGKHR